MYPSEFDGGPNCSSLLYQIPILTLNSMIYLRDKVVLNCFILLEVDIFVEQCILTGVPRYTCVQCNFLRCAAKSRKYLRTVIFFIIFHTSIPPNIFPRSAQSFVISALTKCNPMYVRFLRSYLGWLLKPVSQNYQINAIYFYCNIVCKISSVTWALRPSQYDITFVQ